LIKIIREDEEKENEFFFLVITYLPPVKNMLSFSLDTTKQVVMPALLCCAGEPHMDSLVETFHTTTLEHLTN
jgi:hypothetical protein